MALQPNQRLGPYEILAAIGAGGMGEVYRARDTRLDRTVAIKILLDHQAARPELHERFEREARTVASLNHPHICVLHDIGHQDGIAYLVMEYLEGETLAERLKKGSLPLQQVLQYAIEIADALDKAHRKGITHRDLKPGNIMLTKSGTKLLDFGLAKLKQEATPAVSLSQRPTVESGMTAEGTILGTLQYMAPEQVEGREVDARTDIFAFGAVVYEMATAKKAFEGKSRASLIAKILETDPPPISSLQPMTPPALDRAVKKCLAKEPEKRWQNASDLCDELKWIAEAGSQITLAPTVAPKGIRAVGRRPLILSLGSLLMGLAVASLATWNLKPSSVPPQRVTRFVITLPVGDRIDSSGLALSPDGSHLAYVTVRGGLAQLYLRAMDGLEARPVADLGLGLGIINQPFFSPDSQWLGFFAGGKLMKVSVNGGAALTLADGLLSPSGAVWSSRRTIAFGTDALGPLQEIPDAGGAPHPLTRLDKGEVGHRWPEFLPGGEGVLFIALQSVPGGAKIAAQSLGAGQHRDLLQAGFRPRYAPSGHLIYAQAGNLVAVPFDARRLEVSGAAVPVVEGVSQSAGSGAADYSFSSNGTLAYVSGTETAQTKPVLVSRTGTEEPLAAPVRDYGNPEFSPDGRRIAFTITEGENQIWLYDVAKESFSKFTFEGANSRPLWTRDGKQIAFTSTLNGRLSISWQRADGSGGPEQLTTSESGGFPLSFSPDGQWLAFVEFNPTTLRDVWVLRLSDRKLQPFLRSRFNETVPRFSPDGHWLAYMSDESGRYEIYVQPFPGPGGKYQISSEGGAEPVWNPNGRELFYRSGDKVMAVDVMTQPSLSTGKPRMLFEGRYVPGGVIPSYDVSPDGQRFLMLKTVQQGQPAAAQINVVLNWFEELKQRVPTGKK